jgi:hypothetical protein
LLDGARVFSAGKDKVRVEKSLTVFAYNLRRAINLTGVQPLIQAVASTERKFLGDAGKNRE